MMRQSAIILSVAFSVIVVSKFAKAESRPFHFQAERYSTNLDSGVTKADGAVTFWFGTRSMAADHVEYDPVKGALNARGNTEFKDVGMSIRGSRVESNADTGFGTYHDAVLLQGGQFQVEAKSLAYYAKDKFRADYAKISSCVDCPQAWSVTGSLIDIEIEGFAKIHHAMVLIKDVPVAYFPVFYLPIKSKRQSGFMVPQLMIGGELGSGFLFPYFWAISPNADATLRYDYYMDAGNRAWTEFRYRVSDRTDLHLVSSYNVNSGIRPIDERHRYGVSVTQRAQLSSRWVQRFRSEVASDPRYSYHFEKDFSSARQPTLPTDLSLAWQSETYFFESQISFSQNNIERTALRADYGSINKLPYAMVSAPAQNLGLGIYTDLKAESLSLRRHAEGGAAATGLDAGPNPWIRTGDRFTASASIYRPSSVSWFLFNPELNLRYDQYRLQGDLSLRESPATYPSVSASPQRFRWHFRQDVESTTYRIFDVNVNQLKAVRHSFTPSMTWSYSPGEKRSRHPFFDDDGAPRFDIFDPNSDAAQDGSAEVFSERVLKPHNLLFFGFRTQLTGRFGSETPSYEEFFNLSAAQAYNVQIEQFEDLTISLNAFRYGVRIDARAAVDWQLRRKTYQNSISYDQSLFKVSVVQILTDVPEESGLTKFEEYQFGLDLKKLGPFSLSSWVSYDGRTKRDKEQNYRLNYLSDSKCWFFTMGVSRKQQLGSGSFEFTPYLGVMFSESGENYLPF